MAPKQVAPNFVRYVPAQEGAQPKIIRMVEAQKDPMEPARFKINQKIPGPPPSPPAPVMHSPPRKITAEEQGKWKIPPCISSWKNPRGYTAPLDKRCLFNGRQGAQPEVINPKFAQLSETLYISTRQHRDALEQRMKAEKLIAQKEKEKNEEKLRMLAQQAREERAAAQRGLGHGLRDDEDDNEDESDDDKYKERQKLIEDRHRERVRNANIKARAPGVRTKFDRDRERDISEQIALGMARPNTQDNDVHDQRLYNQSQGLGAGFGDEDDYAVYDKAWKTQASFSTNYRPGENVLREQADRSEPADTAANEDHQQASSSHNQNIDELAPIQFEKDDVEDVFNVESFLRSAKYNARKQQDSQSSHSSKRHKS